eukprot:SAG11_NODE_262_length_11529_cov_12.277603_6_plen_76_part_00
MGVPNGPLFSDSRFADEAFLSLAAPELESLATMPLAELRAIHAQNRQAALVVTATAASGKPVEAPSLSNLPQSKL